MQKVLARNQYLMQLISSDSGKVEGRTPTGSLLLLPDLNKDNLVTQCLHILTNIAGHMDVESTRKEISIPRILGTIARPQWRARCTGVIMYARNGGMGNYLR